MTGEADEMIMCGLCGVEFTADGAYWPEEGMVNPLGSGNDAATDDAWDNFDEFAQDVDAFLAAPPGEALQAEAYDEAEVREVITAPWAEKHQEIARARKVEELREGRG